MPPEQQNNQPVNPNNLPGAPDQTTPPPPASVITPTGQDSPSIGQPVTPTVPQIQAQPQVYGPQPGTAQPSPPTAAPYVNGAVQPAANQPKRRRLMLILILLIVLIVAAAAGYFAFKKPAKPAPAPAPKISNAQSTNMTVKVPADWQKTDTKLGFSISIPAGWVVGTSTNTDINNLNGASATISADAATSVSNTTPTNGTSDSSASAATDTSQDGSQSQTSSQILEVISEKLDTGNSEAAFKQKVTQLSSEDKATLQSLGVDTSKASVSSRSIKLNGKPWLDVTSNIPGQYSENLYYWDNDHAIGFIGVDASQAKVKQLAQKYLYPMAASVTIDKTIAQ